MATLTVQDSSRDGLNIVFDSADVAGDEFANTGNEQLIFKNDDASLTTVTIAFQTTVDGQDITCASRTVVVPAGEITIAGLWRPTNTFNDGNGSLQITYSSVTSLGVAAVKVS